MSIDASKLRTRINGELVKNETGFTTSKDSISIKYHVIKKEDFKRFDNPALYQIDILYEEDILEEFHNCEFLYLDYDSKIDKIEITAKFSIS